MRLLIIILSILTSCKYQFKNEDYLINPKAKQLNDSAISLVMRSSNYKMAVKLLDQATKIDSNYFAAYSTKFVYQQILKEYDSSLITAKILNKLRPEDPQYYAAIGYLYFVKGDTISFKEYYKKAIVHYDKILDTMSISHNGYKQFQIDKAFSLAFIGEKQKSNSLFKQIYDREQDDTLRNIIMTFMNEPREKLLKRMASRK